MPALIAVILLAIVVLIVVTIAVHILFSPLLLLVAAVGILAWIKFRPRTHRQ
jgi:hypothetical protein